MRYIVSLHPFGQLFMNRIQELDLGNVYATDPTRQKNQDEVILTQQHIFKESTTQITNIVTPDMPVFLRELQKLPHLKYMQNVGELMVHGPRLQAFQNVFREYAMQLFFALAKHVPITLDKDYIVEGSEPTYCVILVTDKPKELEVVSF